ncbi:MAG: leukotoxin LktA family filamentous adhesin, partial [Akkermansia sp.]|nr:leukotoxin LktA family filamentous adhesin [Akkermansia sp.]
MKLHLPCRLFRAIVRAMFAASTVVATLASATLADMITPDGRTATQVIQSGDVYDVYTNTVRGNTGFNSFSTFDVYAETTANLHLADGTGKLINVVRDSSSHIDGVLNSYKDGRIGGDVYFLNPHGIIVGKSGIINAGSVSMSTPTAAFVEQLIARDGSISPTATQAVLAGDMPINEKGTISIKGKVNAARSVELRAGNVEVKEGKVSTDVKFGEMVNTGDRKVDTQGMSIRDGRLSFSGSPAQEGKAAEPEAEPEVEAAEEPEVEAADGLASISIFADNVQVDGSALNAASVYIDPDVADITGAISGDYTVEARVITAHDIWVEAGKKLSSFTVNGNNEREAGDVSITITNLNITADTVNITASATTGTDGALISIASSSITSTQAEDCGMCILASSTNGNAGVDIQTGVTLTSPGGMIVAAATGAVLASEGLDNPDQEEFKLDQVEFKPAEGGGNASVTVGGKLQAKSALTVTAVAMGTSGDASVDIAQGGMLSSSGTETKKVGELAFERKAEYVVNENDTEEWVNYKNAAYLHEYDQYLQTLESATVASGTIDIAATSAAGNASVTQTSTSTALTLVSNKSASITAEAAGEANVQLNGRITSGDISATAKGTKSTLRVGQRSRLTSGSYKSLEQEGTVVSVVQNNGMIALEAGKPEGDQSNPAQTPVPANNGDVLLEVAGQLNATRGEDDPVGEEASSISLVSSGKLTVASTAKVYASADNAGGKGGSIYLDADEYNLPNYTSANKTFNVKGNAGDGTIFLMNHNVLEGDDINEADTIASDFIKETLGLSATNGNNAAPKEWTSGFTLVKLSGDIKLTKDVEASICNSAIADGTHIYGEGHSLTLTNSGWHLLSPVSMVTIGKDVTIEGVKDFTFNFRKKSLVQTLTGFYVFSPTSLTVGDNFKVQAGGDVTIAMEGSGNTYIEFGKGLDIQAGGNVSITATNTNGWGGVVGNTSSTDVLASIVKLIPGANETAVGNALSKLGVFQFKTGTFFSKTIKRIFNIEDKPNPKSLPQIGARVSMASVTFANENAGSIRGNSVTIGSATTADVSGLQIAKNGGSLPFALSAGFIYDRSLVDLGKGLQITATGFKEVGKGENKRDVSVSITSTTNSKISLGCNFTNKRPDYAIGLLLAVGIDNNTVKIDKSVNITAERNIDILTQSNIDNDSFLSLDCGMDKKVQPSNPEPGTKYQTTGVPANNLIMFGLDLLKHESNTTISGTLVSNNGDINMESVDNISSSLSMTGTIQYTASLAEAIKDPESQGFGQFLWSTFKDCFDFDLAISRHNLGDVIEKFSSDDGLGQDLDAGNALLQGMVGSEPTKDHSVAVSIATDIVITQNKLLFDGEAHADNGSITLNAETSIEEACGAETSIVGVPSKLAVSGSVSVPVLVGDTTVEVGPDAIISAGGDISVSSSTDLPMSFDFIGWNAWAKFLKSTGASKAGDFIAALRGSLKYVQTYGDNGEFGVLGAMTSSHASTLMKGTGAQDEDDTITVGGDLVVDVRNLNTKTIIGDRASLTAGGKLSATSSSTGTQVSFAGQLPVFLSIGSPTYLSSTNAASGFGGSVIVGEKTLNTVTYIGAAKLKAGQLEVESTGDAFMMEMSLAGTFGTGKNGVQGGVNVIIENKTTVSEISGGADITITGDEASSVTATDGSTLLNISGMEADGGQMAIGVGVAVTLNKALTAAMLGNNDPINIDYADTWKSLSDGYNMQFARDIEISLTFKGESDLSVLAENTGTLVNVGISGAVQTSSGEGSSPLAAVAANVGVLYSETEATARQYAVNAIGYEDENGVSTEAFDYTTIVSVAGDASINLAGKNVVTGAGALSVNRADMNTKAEAKDCNYLNFRDFIVYSVNMASAVAVDVAASIGSATANIAAGSSWNSMTGNTSAYLGGGLVKATYVAVDAFTDLTSLSITLGAAVNFSHGSGVPDLPDVPGGKPTPEPKKPDNTPEDPTDPGPNQGAAPLPTPVQTTDQKKPYTPNDESGNMPPAPLPTPNGDSGNWEPAPTAGGGGGDSPAAPILSDNLLFDKGDTSFGKYVGGTLGESLNNNQSDSLENRLENNNVDAPPPAATKAAAPAKSGALQAAPLSEGGSDQGGSTQGGSTQGGSDQGGSTQGGST